MNAPVVIFAYDRKEHLIQTMNALTNADGSDSTKVYVFSDAAKSEKSIHGVNEVREYLHDLEKTHSFETMEIICAEQNKGLSKSIIEGITCIVNEYGRVIVLEDDIVVAKDFLMFMNRALDHYETDNKVWAISAYVEDFDFLKKHPYKMFAYWRADCWGWATWSDRWNLNDWNVTDYKQFAFSMKKRKEFNRGGEDLSRMLDAQMVGAVNSWAIRWCYSAYKHNMLTMHPTISRTANIGLDGSGEHCTDAGVVQSVRELANQECIMNTCELEENLWKEYTRCMKNRYTFIYRLRKNVKSLIRRIKYCFGTV